MGNRDRRRIDSANCGVRRTNIRLLLAGAALVAAMGLGAVAPARADEDSARKVLKGMSDYLASQQNVSAKYDVDLEIITPDVEKLAFTASGRLDISRPDKIRVTRTGGYADVEMVFDGKTVTVLDRANSVYSQMPAPGTLDALVDRMRGEFNVQMPAMDLLLANSYAALMDDVIVAKHIGRGVIDGVECEHLAFRNADVDWQLWVRTGPKPVPCKYVITSKTVAAAPQYTARLTDFRTDDATPASYAFSAPAGAQRVPFDQLGSIGELPPPAPLGGR